MSKFVSMSSSLNYLMQLLHIFLPFLENQEAALFFSPSLDTEYTHFA